MKRLAGRLLPLKKAVLVSAVFLSIATLATAQREVSIWVIGNGTASEPDRSSADAEALDQATTFANSVCPGLVQNVMKTSDFCGNLSADPDNPNWMCTVSVKAQCIVATRGR